MSESDDDVPQLSAETFLALNAFYEEEKARENYSIEPSVEGRTQTPPEDWQLSQFWYDEKTIEDLSMVAVNTVQFEGNIALISCPTLYKKIKEATKGEVTLYEYDRRFSVYGEDYRPYDYKMPLGVPRDKSSYYDLVIADPPFLSEECLAKTAVTMKFLTKEKMLLCTGAVMAELAERLLNLKKTSLKPKHKNNLANEFWCYSNYDIAKFMI